MIVRALDSQGDWTFGKGLNSYKSGLAAIEQNLKTRINAFFGDCFFDQLAGIDWFNLLGSKNEVALSVAISAVIYATQGVTGIISITITPNDVTRKVVIQYTVSTNLGALNGAIVAGP